MSVLKYAVSDTNLLSESNMKILNSNRSSSLALIKDFTDQQANHRIEDLKLKLKKTAQIDRDLKLKTKTLRNYLDRQQLQMARLANRRAMNEDSLGMISHRDLLNFTPNEKLPLLSRTLEQSKDPSKFLRDIRINDVELPALGLDN